MDIDKSIFEQTRKNLLSPWKWRLYMFRNLPGAWFFRVRTESLTLEECRVQLPFFWGSKNPFRSIYFAAQMAAGEMSTGLPLMTYIRSSGESVSMLVRSVEAQFDQKADQMLIFHCEHGDTIRKALDETIETGEGVLFTLHTKGYLPNGVVASTLDVTWSIKRRSKK